MSIFASRSTEDIALPFDAPHTVTICGLSGRQLARCREVAWEKSIEQMERIKKYRTEVDKPSDPEAVAKAVAVLQEQQRENPLIGVDIAEVLIKGIKGWSYDVPVTRESLPDLVADLTDEAATFIADKIMRKTLPSSEAATKND